MVALVVVIAAAVLGSVLVQADNPVKSEITTSANKQKVWDLRDKSSSTYSDLSNEHRVFDGDLSSSVNDQAYGYKRIGAAFEFKSPMIVHEVKVWFRGSGADDWDNSRNANIHVGNNGGYTDQRFGKTGRDACSDTNAWGNTNGVWTLTHSDKSISGSYLSIVAKSNDCDRRRRRRALQSAATLIGDPSGILSASTSRASRALSSHGRMLWWCGSRECGDLEVKEVRAYQFKCPAGTYPEDRNSFANGNCKDCPNGFWCPGGALGQSASVYKHECPINAVGTGTRKSTQADGCVVCDAGEYATSSGCVACSTGSFCPSGSTTESPCAQGSYCPTPASQIACPGGSVCPTPGLVDHQPCPGGVYCSDGVNQVACPAGHFCPAASSSPTDCPEGSYCPEGSTSATPCVPGEVCPAESPSPTTCPEGHFCPDGVTAVACPLGTFYELTAATAEDNCTLCDPGTYGIGVGKASSSEACASCGNDEHSIAGAEVCYPRITSVSAEDTDSIQTGFSAADEITIRFGGDTHQPAISKTASSEHGKGPLSVFVFWSEDKDGAIYSSSPSPDALASIALVAGVAQGSIKVRPNLIGDGATDLSAEWVSASIARITVIVPPADLDEDLISIQRGKLRVFPAPNKVLDSSFDPESGQEAKRGAANPEGAANSAVVTGTWGVEGDPALVSAILRDTAGMEGMSIGDTIELQFNQLLAGQRLDLLTADEGNVTGAGAVIELIPHDEDGDGNGNGGSGQASSSPTDPEPLTGWAGTAEWGRKVNGASAGQATGIGPGITDGKNATVIIVTITQVPDWASLRGDEVAPLLGGRLSVRVRASANLRGTGLASILPPANNTVVTSGSWGEVPSTPVFRSHSSRSALLTWREPHRPEGQLTVEQWASLGLDGFAVLWCEAGAAEGEEFGPDAVAVARTTWPLVGGNRSTLGALVTAGRCASAFVARPSTDMEMQQAFTLPLLSAHKAGTTSVAVQPERAIITAVAAVFRGTVGPWHPAFDATPSKEARAAQRQGTGGSDTLPRAECFLLSFKQAQTAGSAPPDCVPGATVGTPTQQRSCRCRAVVPGTAVDRRAMGLVLGSAFAGVLAPSLDGVQVSGDLGTPGGEFFTVHGAGMPASGSGLALGADHETSFRTSLAAAIARASNRAQAWWNGPGPESIGLVLEAGATQAPYLAVSYGGGTGNQTYLPDISQCSVVVSGRSFRCLSVPGVGKRHTVAVAINGVAPSAPALAAIIPDATTSDGVPVSAFLDYSAPFIQAFNHSRGEDGLPSAGSAQVVLQGRHFGPLGSENVDSVVFSPSRHSSFVFEAVSCTVTIAHTEMTCNTTASAGSSAYWKLQVAGQLSSLPSTDVAAPAIRSLTVLTPAHLVTAAAQGDHALLRAVGAVMAAGTGNTENDSNSTGTNSAAGSATNWTRPADITPPLSAAEVSSIQAAFASLPAAPDLDNLPTGGGALVLLEGRDFGAGLDLVSRIWASRPDGTTKVMHQLDVDAFLASGDTGADAARHCAMVTAHSRIVCQVLPGAGQAYFWRIRVLDQASHSAPQRTAYAPLVLESIDPSEVVSEGSIVTVKARNLPPVGDPFPIELAFNRGNVSSITRDPDSPLTTFSFTSPPVLVRPRSVNGTAGGAGGGLQGGGSEDSGLSSDAFFADMIVTVAETSQARSIPVALPRIESFDADSARRITSAVNISTPPADAGGASAILLEAHGTSFGGYHAGISLSIGGTPCVPLTLQEIDTHLDLPGGYNPHTQFYCWTSQRRGTPRFADGANRLAISSLEYDFDSIKTPPTPTSVAIVNATTGEALASGRTLSTMGNQIIRIGGAALKDVTSVSLLVLGEGATPTAEPKSRPVVFSSPCHLILRASAPEDLCAFAAASGGGSSDASPYCNADAQLLCRTTPGVGGRLYVRAVSSSAATQVSAISPSDLAGFLPPVLDAVAPALLPTSGGEALEVRGSGFGAEALPMGSQEAGGGGLGLGLDLPIVTVNDLPCPLTFRNDTLLRCSSPPGIESSASVRVVVQGQAGVSSLDGAASLRAGFRPPSIAGGETFHADDEALGGGTGTGAGVSRSGGLELPTRGGWLRLVGSDFGPSPTVRLVEAVTGSITACSAVEDASRYGDKSAHNETWCFVENAAAPLYNIELRTASVLPPGRAVTAPFQLHISAPSITGVFVDSLRVTTDAAGGGAQAAAATAASPRSVARADAAAGFKPSPGRFIVHIVGQSFSSAPSVTIGEARCEVVAGVARDGAPLSLGAVEAEGAAITPATYPPLPVDTSDLHAPGAASSTSPPLTPLAAAGQRFRWVTHEVISCVAPAGTGTQALVVTTSSQRVAAAAFSFDKPVVEGASPATIFASASEGPVANVVLVGQNFGTLAEDPATRTRLINVSAALLATASAAEQQPASGGGGGDSGDPAAAAGTRTLQQSAGGGTAAVLGRRSELCTGGLLMRSAHAELLCTPSAAVPVGVVMLRTQVAGQLSSDRALLSLCPPGFVGGPGEQCHPCPIGAFCAGGFAEAQPQPGFFKQGPLTFLACNPSIACKGAAGAGVGEAVFPFESLTAGQWQADAATLPMDSSLELEAAEPPPSPEGARQPAAGQGAWRASAGATALPLGAAYPANGTVARLLDRYLAEAELVQGDQCIVGYSGASCATCSDRFYRLEGRCEPCPELAWLMIPGFIVLLLCLLGVAMYLQKKNVQLAGLSVGVDMMQILSVFAALDLNWPVEIRTVWTTVSMTTFSLEILAPECSIELDYASKFFAVASIPVMLAIGCFALVLVSITARLVKHGTCPCVFTSCSKKKGKAASASSSRARAVTGADGAVSPTIASASSSRRVGLPPVLRTAAEAKGEGERRATWFSAIARMATPEPKQKSRAEDASHALDAGLGLLLTLLYYVYLTAVRNALQPLDCAEIGATDGSGMIEVMQMEPSVVCNKETDPTYALVAPWAVVSLLVYGLGIPVLFGVVLYLNRASIIEDQKLLANGEGHSEESNPHFRTRKRFGRIYADFKPEAYWWRLVLTTRKAMVATVSIMLTGNPTFAASTTALILFVSFLLHNRYKPFLQAPAVSQAFLDLGKSKDELESEKADAAAAAGAKRSSKGRRSSFKPGSHPVAPRSRRQQGGSGRRRGAGYRFCCLVIPEPVVVVLRVISPLFVVCCSDASASRKTSMRPQIDLESSMRSIHHLRNGKPAGSAVASGSSPRADSKCAPAASSKPGSPSASDKTMPMSFASAAAAALREQEEREAKEAAELARSSSLSFVFDYNGLEGSFLITGVLVLMGGLAFSSNALEVGSPPYIVIVTIIVALVAMAVVSFFWVLAFELYRSLRFADVLTQARAYQDKILARQQRRKASLAAAPSSREKPFSGGVSAKLRGMLHKQRTARATKEDNATAMLVTRSPLANGASCGARAKGRAEPTSRPSLMGAGDAFSRLRGKHPRK